MNSGYMPKIYGFRAGAALSQYQFVKFGAAEDTVIPCSANDELMMGVAQGAAASGEICEVAIIGGGSQIKLAATLARGAEVATNASGLGKAAAAAGYVAGVVMASGVAGDIVPMILSPYQKN